MTPSVSSLMTYPKNQRLDWMPAGWAIEELDLSLNPAGLFLRQLLKMK